MASQDDLLKRLKGLNSAQFEEVLLLLKIDPTIIPGPYAEQSSRAIKVIQLLNQQQNGLVRLEEQLAKLAISTTGKELAPVFEGRTYVETVHIQLKLSNQDKDVKLYYSLDNHLEKRSLPLKEIEDIIRMMEQDYYITYLPALIEIGQRLYNWLNGGQDTTQGWLTEAIKSSQEVALQGKQKVVLLAIAATGELAHLPWELLHDQKSFLVEQSNPYLLPVRWVPEKDLSPPKRKEDALRVLFMATSPLGIESILDFEEEEGKILKATADKLLLSVEESGCLKELKKLVDLSEDYFDIFHLTGHATIVDNEPRFLTETDTGEEHYASAKEIAQAFDDRLPQLIFLSGCSTGAAIGDGRAVKATLSMAEQLLQEGARAVLGWGAKVSDSDAIDAAAVLYEKLSSGRELAVAVARTYQTLLEKKAEDWYLLRLYTRGERSLALPRALVLPPAEQQESRRFTVSPYLDPGGKVKVVTRGDFVGRRRQVQNCLRSLNPKSERVGVLIYGMGGLGKSSLANRLCERLNDYERIAYVGRINETDLTKCLEKLLYNDKSLRDTFRSPDDWEYRFMMLFEELYKKHIKLLLVLDAFEKNLESKDGEFVLLPEAETVLKALVSAINYCNQRNFKHRLIITCRYKFQFEHLEDFFYEQPLDALHEADLQKKLNRLIPLNSRSSDTEALRRQVVKLADGNPRLLEFLTKKLLSKGAEQELYGLEHNASHLCQQVMDEELFKHVDEDLRQLLSLALVFNLAIPKAVLVELCANRIDSIDSHINRAIDLGLLEVNSQNDLRVPRILSLKLPLNDEVVHAQGVQILYKTWYQEGKTTTEAQTLEIHRLALLGKDGEIAREITISLSDRWLYQGRSDEVMRLCRSTIEVVKDTQIFLRLAQSETFSERAVKHCQQALECCLPEDKEQKAAIFYHQATIKYRQGKPAEAWEDYKNSLKVLQFVQNDKLKAAILIGVVDIYLDQGQLKLAIKQYLQARKIQNRQLREIQKRINDAQGEVVVLYRQMTEVLHQKAALLNKLVIICSRKHQMTRAIFLCHKSISIKESIGNTHSKATTLCMLAEIYTQQGRIPEAINHYLHCLGIQQRFGDSQGKAATLRKLVGLSRYLHPTQVTQVTELCQEALKICKDIKDKKGEAATLHQLAVICTQKRDFVEAIKYCTESYKIEQNIKHVQGQFRALVMLGKLFENEHNEQKDLTKTLQYLREAQKLLKEPKSRDAEIVSQMILEVEQKIHDLKPI